MQKENVPEKQVNKTGEATAGMLEQALVSRIARLARLDPPEEELALLQGELERILSSFRKLSDIDTAGVAPVYHPQDLLDVLRGDEPALPFARDRLLEPAEDQKDGFFVAPRTLE